MVGDSEEKTRTRRGKGKVRGKDRQQKWEMGSFVYRVCFFCMRLKVREKRVFAHCVCQWWP